MLILTKESLPRWYGLSWRSKEVALALSIHEEFLREETRRRIADPETIKAVKQEFGFATFDPSFETGFGFDDALLFEKKEGDFLVFTTRFPKIRKQLSSRCKTCKGTKRDPLLHGRACFDCRGTGKEHIYDHKPGYALSASLNLFFDAARFVDEKTSAKLPQLLTLHLVTIRDMHGAELGGEYGIELVNWLCRQPIHQNIAVMSDAMRRAPGKPAGNDLHREPFQFRASVESVDGWLNVNCPGDRCGLNPGYRGISPGRGYELASYNGDVPHQQLTLLVGLAALHDQVDAEFKK